MDNLTGSSKEQETPENYPGEYVEQVSLRDGTIVTIRPIRPDDAPRLQAGFARLSPRSIYLRFLEAAKSLPDKQAREFAILDYQARMAFVAEIEEEGKRNLIGVARYAMTGPPEEKVAESAVVVIDEYQNLGLGTILLNRLGRYAIQHGVNSFLATVHQTNDQIMRFIQHSGFPMHKKMVEPGVWEVRIDFEQ